MSEQQTAMTRGFAKGLGLFLILFGLAVAINAPIMWALAPRFFADGALVFITAAFGLGVGCAMVAAHHHFNSLPAIIITLFGWLTIIRCLVLLLAPDFISGLAGAALRVPGLPLIPAAIVVLIGAYLSFVGWFAKPRTTT